MLLDLFEIKNKLKIIDEKIETYKKYLTNNNVEENLKKIKEEVAKDNLWENVEKAKELLQTEAQLTGDLEKWSTIQNEREMVDFLINELNSSNEKESGILVQDLVNNLETSLEEICVNILFNDKNDNSACFLTVHCGSGGLESEDWAKMLWNMYLKYASKFFKYTILDCNNSPEGGIKNATMKIENGEKRFVYGHFKSEIGVHRLVRISPFDKNKQRHTSFCSVQVLPEISENINIEIKTEDLKIDTYRASGAGGQHVNKTESAIRITHMPTGIVVQCQNDRSQHNNKDEALKMLKAKLYERKVKELQKEKENLAGEKKESTWGSQIRSYIQQPYQLVKDHRTDAEVPNFDKIIIEAEISPFINAYLKWNME